MPYPPRDRQRRPVVPIDDARFQTLLADVAEMKTALQLFAQEHSVQAEHVEGVKTSLQKHRDNFKACLHTLEERLHALENFMLASLQRLAFLKGFLRFWPVLVVTFLFFFCVGIFVDDQKVATEIADKMTLKA